MEIAQMRYFRTIAQCGSFSLAAQQLHITQPALSKSIGKLETELETPLFDRKGNKLGLTAAGRIFFTYCGTVLDTVESGISAVKESIGLKQGQLAIAISAEVFIKHLILRFLKQHPGVSFTCHLMNADEMSRALEEGSIDFALSERPVTGDHVEWHRLYSGSLTAVFHRDDPLAQRESIVMEDLREHQFCIGNLRSDLSSDIFQLCGEAGFHPRIRYLGYDPDMAGKLLEIPNSVIISSSSIDMSIQEVGFGDPTARKVPIRGTDGRATVGLAARIGHYQSEAALAFFDMVTEHFSARQEF